MKLMLPVFCVVFASLGFSGCGLFSPLTGTTGDTVDSVQIETTKKPEDSGDRDEKSEANDTKSSETAEKGAVKEMTGVYLGIQDYGYVNIADVDDFGYRFSIDGKECVYKIADSRSKGYFLQNRLKEGYTYDVNVDDGFLVDLSQEDAADDVSTDTPVTGTPGKKTLKNFLTTALMPVGRTLYIYGGGWNWQDEGAAGQTTTIGVSDEWFRFFESQDATFTYKDRDGNAANADPATSYYPYGKFIEYYYAGLDCSGYLGWTLYNTFETENGKEGYVFPSTENSKRLADRGWGEFRREVPGGWKRDDSSVCPGDIVSIKGHVWISLGTCKDGSVVIAHSSPSFSREGQPGGGVQIAALGDDKDCQAYRLADKFMSEYYPEWHERYGTDIKSPNSYFDFQDERAGVFSWNTDGSNGGLTDPDDIRNMDPKNVLNMIYKGDRRR